MENVMKTNNMFLSWAYHYFLFMAKNHLFDQVEKAFIFCFELEKKDKLLTNCRVFVNESCIFSFIKVSL